MPFLGFSYSSPGKQKIANTQKHAQKQKQGKHGIIINHNDTVTITTPPPAPPAPPAPSTPEPSMLYKAASDISTGALYGVGLLITYSVYVVVGTALFAAEATKAAVTSEEDDEK